MPIADKLVHECVLEVATDGTPDRTGHVEPVFLPENEVAFMGNVQERTGIEINGPELGGTVIADTVIFALPSLAITERDRVRHGAFRYESKFVKRLIFGTQNDHLEILARSIRPGTGGTGS